MGKIEREQLSSTFNAELDSINSQLSEKANDTDSNRTTTAKDVTGAINELKGNVTTINTAISDTGWLTATLINNWTGTLKYRKKSNVVFVSISDLVKTTAEANACFILPNSFRPEQTIICATITFSGSLGRVALTNDGSIFIQGYDGTYNKANEKYNQILNF
jgi:hypothetical protein